MYVQRLRSQPILTSRNNNPRPPLGDHCCCYHTHSEATYIKEYSMLRPINDMLLKKHQHVVRRTYSNFTKRTHFLLQILKTQAQHRQGQKKSGADNIILKNASPASLQIFTTPTWLTSQLLKHLHDKNQYSTTVTTNLANLESLARRLGLIEKLKITCCDKQTTALTAGDSCSASEPTQTQPSNYRKARCERNTPLELDLSSKSLSKSVPAPTSMDQLLSSRRNSKAAVCPKAKIRAAGRGDRPRNGPKWEAGASNYTAGPGSNATWWR